MSLLADIGKGLHLGEKPKLKYRADIDGLRAIAVLAVVFYHAGFTWCSGGYVGVDLFFVLSGFLITKIILSDLRKRRFSIKVFYERRVKRLFPALFAHFFVILSVAYFLFLPSDLAFLGENLVAATLFLANLFFWKESGYFAPDSHSLPLLHTWSLAVEEQFYIFWPIVLWLCFRRFSDRATKIGLLLILLLSLGIAWYWVQEKPNYAFYLIPARSFELMIGAWLAFPFTAPLQNRRWAFGISLLAIALVVLPMFLYDHHTSFPGLTALPICMGTGLLIWVGQNHKTAVQSFLEKPGLIFVGLLSYSLYLWHWPIFALGRYALDRAFTSAEALLAIGLSLVVSYLSWKYIEAPFRHSKSPFILHWGVALIGVGCFAGWVLYATSGLESRVSKEVLAADRATQTKPTLQAVCHNPREEQPASLSQCSAGDEAPVSVLLWGDSHGNHFSPMLEQIGREKGFRFTQVTKNACLPLLGVERIDIPVEEESACRDLTANTLSYLRERPEIGTVVLASRWSLYAEGTLWGQEEGKEPTLRIVGEEADADDNHRAFSHGMQELLNALSNMGKEVILLGQVPEFGFYSGKCLAKGFLYRGSAFDQSQCHVSRVRVQERQAFVQTELTRWATERANVRWIPLMDELCREEHCLAMEDGVVLYKDDDHLSVAGSKWLAEQIRMKYP